MKPIPPDVIEIIKDLRAAGRSWMQVAHATGYSPERCHTAVPDDPGLQRDARRRQRKPAGSGIIAPPPYHRGSRWGAGI